MPEAPPAVSAPPSPSADAPATTDLVSPSAQGCEQLVGRLQSPDRDGDVVQATCAATPDGTWALVLHRPAAGARVTSYTLRFAAGARVLEARGELAADLSAWPTLGLTASEPFDFDGDGRPEFLVLVTKNGRNSFVLTRLFLTARSAIGPYPPAVGLPIVALRDVDGDGRPDAVLSYDLGTYSYCYVDEGDPYTIEALAHGLPDGTFSLTDSVALEAVRSRCPAAPKGPPMVDGAIDPGALECARFWGVSTANILSRVAAACGPRARCNHACPARGAYEAIARWKPPLLLK